jgi:alpha/beta superfamily hydrolase
MQLTEKLKFPGEQSLLLAGVVGQLDAVLTVPEQINTHYVAILGHPHSLQGGTMNNKVVTTLARMFKELGIASLRFNFRGVGLSEGEYDAGIGESEDMLLLARQWLNAMPGARILFAGFSFGSYVAYRAAAQCPHALLITIAPSIEHYDYSQFSPVPKPWIVVQGGEDEIVPAKAVVDFVANALPPLELLYFEHTTHFFHGRLIELKLRLMEAIRNQVEIL